MDIKTQGDQTIITMDPGEELQIVELKPDNEEENEKIAFLKNGLSAEMTMTTNLTKRAEKKLRMVFMGKENYNAWILHKEGHLGPDNCWKH